MAEIEPKATPMMAQYLAIKRQQPDCLLFYRMGDFYELFFEDAVEAAAALDITLTKRGQHLGEDIPMCGVPVHSADSYLARLIRKGFRVAVCEQTEDPAEAKKRGAKSVVERAVTRVVTPGTLTEDTLLDARSNNYLAALAKAGRDCAVAWADMSTGSFHVQPVDEGSIPAVIARIAPGELLVSDRLMNEGPMGEILAEWDRIITPLPAARFDSVNAEKRLKELYGVSSLDAYGDFDRAELAAAGTLVDYVELTQVGQLPRLDPISRVAATAIMEIDQATRRNLELVRTLSGERTGSLLSTIDRTVTGPGARLTAVRLSAPLTDPARINARLDHVEAYVTTYGLREDIRELLRRTPDIERALSRLSLQRGGPRDLAALRDGLALTAKLKALVSRLGPELPSEAAHVIEGFGIHDETVDLLARALAEELPVNTRDGGFIAKGFAPELDELKALRDEGRRMIANLEAEYRKLSGVDQLKIKHNNVLGYFIEVSAKNAERMGEPFIHRQTMSNAVRYTTAELGDLARRISEAGDRSLAVEQEIFADLVSATLERASDIAFAAQALAELDWACGLAELAASADWTRPSVDDSLDFHIEGGRHPVVEAALSRQGGEPFVPNDCDLAREERLWLLTGPNMAGKSTFLRQNALIAILAQTGSFVPAKEARIGVVDRLFSRVGAADDLARGRSTFMVEMVETATILNQATGRSLVILDEIGRGTATFDGLSIAWACVEHLHETSKARALFATHYHELTALAERLDALSPHCMRVKEWEGKVVFMHEVAKGSADRSYGIHVARLAGLPKSVVDRAEEVLHTLEKGEQSGAVTRLVDDLPLFQAIRDIPKVGQTTGAAGTAGSAEPARPHPAVEALKALDLDDMTPREALNALYRLKALGKEEG